jgi:hypothetical protein
VSGEVRPGRSDEGPPKTRRIRFWYFSRACQERQEGVPRSTQAPHRAAGRLQPNQRNSSPESEPLILPTACHDYYRAKICLGLKDLRSQIEKFVDDYDDSATADARGQNRKRTARKVFELLINDKENDEKRITGRLHFQPSSRS